MELEALIKKLQAIAEKNDDEFSYRIDVEPSRNGSLTYTFVCGEQADGHEFVSAKGRTLEEVCKEASQSIAAACDEWGYEEA